MKVTVLIIIFAGILAVEIHRLIKKRMWRTLVVVCVLILTGFTLSLLQIIGIKIPNPNNSIEGFVKMIIPEWLREYKSG